MSDSTYNAETIAERRKFERYQLSLKVHYAKADGHTPADEKNRSISLDLGIGGVAIILTEPLDPGQTLQIEIALPNVEELFSSDEENYAMSATEKSISLLSKVVWCRLEEDDHYLAGVQFIDLEKEDARALKSFLEEYSLHDVTQSDS